MTGLTFNLDWLYHGAGWVLGASGIGLLLWIFLPIPTRKRRCPRCWYDMSGTPGLRCSECGREASSERKLHKLKRPRRVKLLALAALLLGRGVWLVPRYIERTWRGLIPSTYLVFFAPAQDDPGLQSSVWGPGLGTSSTPPPKPTTTLVDEVWFRLHTGSLARWQSQIYLDRYLKDQKIDPAALVSIPKLWPLGPRVPVHLNQVYVSSLLVTAADSQSRLSGDTRVHTHPRRGVDVQIELLAPNWRRVVYRCTRSLPIDMTIPAESFMIPVDSPELTEKVHAELAPHLSIYLQAPALILHDRPEPEPHEMFPFLLGYTVEIRAAGHSIVTHADSPPWEALTRTKWAECRLQWPPGSSSELFQSDTTITIQGDPAAALDVFMKSAFDDPPREFWAGHFTAPLPLLPDPRPQLP